MKLRKLRTRLILTYSSIIVLGFIGLTLIAGGQIARSANEDFDRAVSESASLIARSLGDSVEHWLNGEDDSGSLTNTLNGLSRQEGGEVTLLGSSGQVLLTTARKHPSAAELLTYPEVLAALRGQAAHERRTSTTGVQYVYATAPIMDDEEPVAVVIVTAPLRDVGGLVNQRWIALASGVGILMWLTVAASILLAGSLTHPLEQLRTSALRLASGDLDTHIEIRQSGEIGDLAEAFIHMSEQVRAMLEEQRAFASNAAHELRTPLTTVRLRSEALREGQLDADTSAQYIREIDDEVIRMGRLIDDLILLSRLDAGRAELGVEEVDIIRFARSLAREFQERLTACGITFTLDVEQAPSEMRASLNHLHVVFRNLLDNAIKYTPEGGTIVWTLWQDESDLTSTLSDSGPGLGREDLDRVFNRFYRADKAHSRTVPGSGLGLALARSTVSAYGGSLKLVSDGPGHGVTAVVRWPLRLSSSRE